ncbi:MAG: lipid A biosynthesis lauroyl acyltransferase [Xanthobacteraceae bacterium]|jgi:KDO2-lipid IV(A) lauroyltransferase
MAERKLKALLDAAAGASAVGLLGAVKRFDRKRTANFAGAAMRRIGPLFKEHRLARANLRIAYPEKSDAEIEQILAGVWDNLGRITVEFAHLDEFCVEGVGRQTPDVITYAPEATERYRRMLDRGKPMLGFAAHLANWELPAVVAKVLVDRSAVLYRRPNIRSVSDIIVKLREPLMGELIPTGLEAPLKLARLIQSGTHVGMLVDQHFTKGVEVTFFGRRCLANPLIALLARQTEAPIHGLRVVRKPDGNSFSVDITDPVEPARDADGRIDIKGTMQAITAVVEGWVREHPEQWLWLHHRWR